MRKHIVLFILILLISANGWSQSSLITMRIPDTTFVKGSIIDLPVYADSSLTDKNVISYALQLNYDQSYFQVLSVFITGTISASFGDPNVNTSVPGKISVAGAGTSPLSGIGKFIFIRLKVLNAGYTNITFSGSDNSYFNEGNPVMGFTNGYININSPPSINVSPNEGIICKGEQFQFGVYGGTAPYQWFVTNPSVASISSTGLLDGVQTGLTKVVVQDNNGIRDTTDNNIEIRALRLIIADTLSTWKNAYIDVPVNTTSLDGLNITSGNFSLSVDTNIMRPVGVVQTGTILDSYGSPSINIDSEGVISIGFAGSTALSGSGTLLYVRYRISAINSGSTNILISNILFNQNILAGYTNGRFTVRNFNNISISPNSGSLITGETQMFTVDGGGTPPFTWSVDNSVLASINQSGLMTTYKSGIVRISVIDAVGASAYSGDIMIYDASINIPDTITCPETLEFYYPISIKSLPSGKSIFSVQATVNFDTTYLAFLDIDMTGTLTEGWTYAKNTSYGQVILAGSGSSSFNSNGTILNLKFSFKTAFTNGATTSVNLNNFVLNEGSPYPLVDNSGSIASVTIGSAGTISGTGTVCQGQTNINYYVSSITNATGYVWAIPTGASIVSGENTNSIWVDYSNSAASGNITVYGNSVCGNGNVSPDYVVTINPLPGDAGTITGQVTFCPGENAVTYTVPDIAEATSYTWTLPSGATGSSTTNTILVDYDISAISGDIIVNGQNSCGSGTPSVLFVSVNPSPSDAGTISGNTTVCKGESSVSYTVPEITDAISYIWSLPSGATGTSTTNTISVDFGMSAVSGDITVKGHNVCGDGTISSLSVTVNSSPSDAGTISGNTTVCQGEDAVIYTLPEIANASSYIWTLPTGATGASTTNTITVDFGISAVSGNISVRGQNSCGNGVISSLSVVVNSKPATPVVTLNADTKTLHSNAVNGNQWYKGDTLLINSTDQEYIATATGNYSVIVTNNGCSSDQSNVLNVTIIGIESLLYNNSIKVFPNPVSDELIIEIEDGIQKRNFEILNSLGQSIYKGNIVERAVVQTTSFSSGIYFIRLGNGNTFEFRKIVKK